MVVLTKDGVTRPSTRRRPPTPRAVATALRFNAARNGYEMTVEQRDALLDEQGHLCALCQRPFRRPAWHLECTFEGKLEGRRVGTSPNVDHDHKTGAVRGLLCRFCNREVVPMVERHLETLKRAIRYVRMGGITTP